MNYFEKNIELIQNKFPNLYDKLNSFNPDLSKFLLTEDKEGRTNLIMNHINGNVHVYSNYDMEEEIRIWMSDLEDEDNICVLGFGTGYHIKRLLKTNIRKIVVVEPDMNMFLAALSTTDIRDIIQSERVVILIDEDFRDISNGIYHYNNEGMVDGIIFKALNSYRYIYNEWWNGLKNDFKGKATLFGNNIATKIVFAKDWTTNVIKNMNDYPNSALVEDYIDKFSNYPAIIVGAGPSLKKNMHLLNDLKDKALIFGVGSAVNILEKNDIKPHFMVGIDGSPEESNIFNNIGWDDVKFIYSPKIHHEGLGNYKGPKIYMKLDSDFLSSWVETKVNKVTSSVESAATVSIIAGDVARKMGCEPIIFIGQDLCYTDGANYADGAVHYKDMQEDGWDKITIKDIYGNDVYTNRNWNSLRISFENYMANHKENLFIDATEGGALKKGAVIMTLKSAIDKYCSLDNATEKADKIFEESLYNKRDITEATIKELKQYILKEVKNIFKLSEAAANISETMHSDLCMGRNDIKLKKNNNKLNEINEKIEKNDVYNNFVHPIYDVFLFTIQDELRRNIDKEKNILNKQKKLVKSSISQYLYIKEICVHMEKLLEEELGCEDI